MHVEAPVRLPIKANCDRGEMLFGMA